MRSSGGRIGQCGHCAGIDRQLTLELQWSRPTDRVAVSCTGCEWRGRRTRRSAGQRGRPRCGGVVRQGRPVVGVTDGPASRGVSADRLAVVG
jgi:hypothetical protein